jgi:hypothetical protein
MNWRCLASELRLNPKTIEFLSSFIRNVVRKGQFPVLDLRHLHFFNPTHPNVSIEKSGEIRDNLNYYAALLNKVIRVNIDVPIEAEF